MHSCPHLYVMDFSEICISITLWGQISDTDTNRFHTTELTTASIVYLMSRVFTHDANVSYQFHSRCFRNLKLERSSTASQVPHAWVLKSSPKRLPRVTSPSSNGLGGTWPYYPIREHIVITGRRWALPCAARCGLRLLALPVKARMQGGHGLTSTCKTHLDFATATWFLMEADGFVRRRRMTAESASNDPGVAGASAGAEVRWLGGRFWGVSESIVGSLTPRIAGETEIQTVDIICSAQDAHAEDSQPDYEGLPQGASTSTHMLAGAVAGIMEHCLMFPIDCVKVAQS